MPLRDLFTVSLPVQKKINHIPMIVVLLGNNRTLLTISGNMAGDPYNGVSPDCSVSKGID